MRIEFIQTPRLIEKLPGYSHLYIALVRKMCENKEFRVHEEEMVMIIEVKFLKFITVSSSPRAIHKAPLPIHMDGIPAVSCGVAVFELAFWVVVIAFGIAGDFLHCDLSIAVK